MELGECDLDHQLKFSTDSSKLEGTLRVEPLKSVKGVGVDAFEAYLLGRDVRPQSIDREALKALCDAVLASPLETHEMIVARGTPAINGNSVTYTISEDIAKEIEKVKHRIEAIKSGKIQDSAPPKVETRDEDESISYYDQMSFVIVHKGDVIAFKSERSDGYDGIDIFGKTIPAHEGKANDGVLDDSILVSADGTCTTVVSGVLTAEPSNISVSEHLIIQDDVNFKTGRITFPGSVEVHGAVRDRFSVRSTGDISIRGLVEASILESETNITLSRGMAGKDSGTIKAGRNLESGYLESVMAQVSGDVLIKSEITNCDLEILGQLKAEHAAVRGGRIHVSKGATIGSVGSIQGVVTEIVIGSIPEIEHEIRSADEFLVQLDNEIKSKTTKMESINALISKPTASQIEERMGMQFVIDEMTLRRKQLAKARAQLVEIMLKNTNLRLQITKGIYSKSVVYIPGYRVEFPTDLMGESVIELGVTGHPIITLRGTTEDLKKHARVVPDERVLRLASNESDQVAA